MHASKAQSQSIGRLKRRSDFLRVQATGRKWVSTHLVLQMAENDLGVVRFGLTVTKKTSKSAVIRNRIRRRLRALALDTLPGNGQRGTDYVLIGRLPAHDAEAPGILRDLLWCLKRLHMSDQAKKP